MHTEASGSTPTAVDYRQQPASTALGNWYATALFWKPQLALLVNERRLLPVLMPLAPAVSLPDRAGQEIARALARHGVDPDFIARARQRR